MDTHRFYYRYVGGGGGCAAVMLIVVIVGTAVGVFNHVRAEFF